MEDIDKIIEEIKKGTLEIINEKELKEKLEKSRKENKPLKIKLGMDPTAPHVHLGFAVVLRKLRQFQDLGHEVILIIGDFTARIGDPSGRSIMRPMLTEEEIQENAKTYMEQYTKILNTAKVKIVYNSQWLSKLSVSEIISLTSKYTVARILERDDFSNRYKKGHPIGVHEFLYPLFQGYDSVALDADIELGGLDQKFNILVGRELQREYGKIPQVAIFMPILEGLDGVQKMSKSLGNYVGITEEPDQMYGKIMSIPDNLIVKYFQLCTDLPEEEIKEIDEKIKKNKINPKDAKMKLAGKIVATYHNKELAKSAEEEFQKIFSKKELPSEITEVKIYSEDLSSGKIWIAKLLILAGFASSKREARRLISQGAVQIDGEKINTPDLDIQPKNGTVLKVGTRNFAKISIEK